MTQVAEPQASRYVGGGLLRKEDPKLLTGQGRYVDDLSTAGMAWIAFVRSPLAHARITRVDPGRALAMPGVTAVYTGEDLAPEWAAGLPCVWPVTPDIKLPNHWPVAKDKVRYAGDAVAVVVADSREHAADAVEAVDVDYQPLDVVLDLDAALADGAPLVHDELGTNACYTWTMTNGDAAAEIAAAPVVVKERYWQPRLVPNAIEPRGLVVELVPSSGRYTLWSSTQVPHVLRTLLAITLGIPEERLRVITPDVGGGFGSKLQVYAEEAVGLAVARRLGRPVKWIEERAEGYLATHHGRGMWQEIEVAADSAGKLRGLRVRLVADMGAYLQLLTPGIPLLGAFLYPGVYQAAAYSFECTGVFTNRTPTDAYRGAGRPEAAYAIERVMDALARRLELDPAVVRRRNLIPRFDQPCPTVGGLSYDSGDYEKTLARALELIGYDDLRREQAARRAEGRRPLGIGLSTYIELCGWAPSQALRDLRYAGGGWESSTIRCHPTGKVTIISGASPHGQGGATTYAQIVADDLGVAFDDVDVLHGDTDVAPLGWDTYGSRGTAVGAEAVHRAAEKVRTKARRIAAHELEVAEDDLEWLGGRFQVRGVPDKHRTVAQLAFSAWTAHDLPADVEPGLEATATYDPPNLTYPSGAHVCAVEVDPETGAVEILRYVAVDDCGNQINPVIVEGQVHGGIAQGIAEALYEEAVYDEAGTLVTGSMATYRIPSAVELPRMELDWTVTPSSTNSLGVKGIGEAGTIASPPCVVNAVVDALVPLGVTHLDKPLTPERVWRAIQVGGRR